MSELESLVRELARQVVRDELARAAPAWEWLDVPATAGLLGCSTKAVYSKIERGVLTPHKFDSRIYLSRQEIDTAIRKATG